MRHKEMQKTAYFLGKKMKNFFIFAPKTVYISQNFMDGIFIYLICMEVLSGKTVMVCAEIWRIFCIKTSVFLIVFYHHEALATVKKHYKNDKNGLY